MNLNFFLMYKCISTICYTNEQLVQIMSDYVANLSYLIYFGRLEFVVSNSRI